MSLRPDQLGKPLKVIKRVQETPDAVSLVLEIPDALKGQFHYQAGQFVTFFLDVHGETLNRSYSLSSSPLVDGEFQVTVKRVHGGRASTFLTERAQVGDVLLTSPPAGAFFKPSLEPKHYVLFAGGSGITPIYSILKTVLTSSKQNQVTLIYCNRDEEAIIYRSGLDAWAKEHPGRLEIIHALSKPSSSWSGHRGRADKQLVGQVLSRPGGLAREYYLCGPTAFMELVRSTLLEGGVLPDRIRQEDFATTLHKPGPKVNSGWTFIGREGPVESPEKIIAQINGQTVEVAAKEGQSILETLLESGAQPPYSCMDGACMACMAKIVEGRVYQEDPGILTDDNIAHGEALTCQAKPLSRIVRVSYDNL